MSNAKAKTQTAAKPSGSGEKGGAKSGDCRAIVAAVARKGLRTIDDVIAFSLALVTDSSLGNMGAGQVNATCNALGKVAKFIELREKYRVQEGRRKPAGFLTE